MGRGCGGEETIYDFPGDEQGTQPLGSRCIKLAVFLLIALSGILTVFIRLYINENHQLKKVTALTAPLLNDGSEAKEGLLKRISDLENASSEGWRYFNNSFYYLSDDAYSWHQSRQFCLDRGAHLVIVNSREEQDFLIKVVKENRGDGVWIGLSNVDGDNRSTWAPNAVESDTAVSPPLKKGCVKLQVYDNPLVREVSGGKCEVQKYCICQKLMTV